MGLVTRASLLDFTLSGSYLGPDGQHLPEGHYQGRPSGEAIALEGPLGIKSRELSFFPQDPVTSRFTINGVTIGIDFHWERKEDQTFVGSLKLGLAEGKILAVNEVPLESYLTSVISSEMSASSPTELLRAHAIVSRSWLLAQLYNPPATVAPEASAIESSDETVRWYTRESHQRFDVCADDHCQRYQGVTKAFSPAAYDAVKDTRGKILVYGGDICDARYSKSCGGVTEVYSAAWDNTDIPYLSPVYDGPGPPEDGVMPLTREENAIRWISSSPAAFCNTSSADLLSKILPGFDQETRNFYRWEVVHDASELGELVSAKLGVEFGRILDLIPLERGPSGRIVRLRIAGEKRTLVIGKELEIRRALSQSHLYSSAFVVHKEHAEERGRPPMRADNEVFRITGAGWGHGVGMCQIGAAVMADQGYVHDQIVAHYFRGSTLRSIY